MALKGARPLPEPGLSRSAAPDDETVIDVRDLRMRYGKTDVLNGVSFTARRGEVAEYFEIPVEVIFSTVPFPRLGSGQGSASA